MEKIRFYLFLSLFMYNIQWWIFSIHFVVVNEIIYDAFLEKPVSGYNYPLYCCVPIDVTKKPFKKPLYQHT